MMNKKGFVYKIDDNKLEVILMREASCGSCSSCGGGCSPSTFNLDIENSIDAEVGDLVEIEYKSKSMILTTALLYVFPLIMLVVGILVANAINFDINPDLNDLFSFVFGLVFMIISYLIIHLIDKKLKTNQLINIRKVLE